MAYTWPLGVSVKYESLDGHDLFEVHEVERPLELTVRDRGGDYCRCDVLADGNPAHCQSVTMLAEQDQVQWISLSAGWEKEARSGCCCEFQQVFACCPGPSRVLRVQWV